MKLGALLCIVVISAGTSACSSIIEGTHQEIAIATNPPGAACTLKRQEIVIATVSPTPGSAKIEKTKYDIVITCDKDGFQEATLLDKSGAAAATFGNILAGGGIGWAIDSAAGADNKYDSPVTLTLEPVPAKNAAADSTQK